MAARGDETNRRGDRSTAGLEPDEAWWRSGVLYQIYPRSFADSDGDGVGDLQGVIDRLDHLAWLGVDAIWMNPITPSPDADWGYDVADFTSVHPDLGTLETFDRLVTATGERGIRVMLDLVPNHTSDHHPWFEAARSERGSPFRERYVWADPKPDGSPPNNWRSTFGGPAWTLDAPSGQYYLHNFLPEQPDLNWWNDGVRDAFDEVLRFWMDRGVEGFRIDVANGLVKDRELRDNPPVTQDDHPIVRRLELRPVHNMNRPEVHGIWRRWRAVVDRHAPPGVLLGETWVLDLDVLAAFYGSGEDELHLAMNFPFIFSPLEPGLRQVVEGTEAVLPTGAWPSWLGSNHDVGRFPTRWCDGDERKVRAAMLMLLTLRGTPILYAGDEIGMPEVTVPRERLRDPVGIRGWPDDPGRDGARTPMQWSRGEGAGFTRPGVETWLPLGDAAACNVADQRDDPGSTLRLCRDLLGLRRARRDLRDGSYGTLSAADGVWSWRRGRATAVALNLSEHAGTVDVGEGTCLVGTDRSRDGAAVEGPFELAPWEGVVIETGVVAP